jgi:uncharacterized protein YjgD (DUF1641 family)
MEQKLKAIIELADTALDMDDQGIIDALYEIKHKAREVLEMMWDLEGED